MKYFFLVWAGLWRNRTRTILTMLSVMVAFLLYGLLQGLNGGIDSAVMNADIDRLFVINRADMNEGLPISYLERIRSLPGVVKVSHWTYFGGYYREARNPVSLYATEPKALFEIYDKIKVDPEQVRRLLTTRSGALISTQLAKRWGWKVGDRVPIGTSIWTNKSGSSVWDFEIVGIYDATAYGVLPAFFINFDYLDSGRRFGNGAVHYYIVRIANPRHASSIASAIDAQFSNSVSETRTQTETAFAGVRLKQFGDIGLIANAIVGAVLFTLLFLTANTMTQSVIERVPELAVLKSMGYTDRHLLVLVFVESGILCIVAAAAGLVLARLTFRSPRIAAILGDFSIPVGVLAIATGAALLLALMSSLYPAWFIKRISVVDALARR